MAVITVTEAAQARLKYLIDQSKDPVVGIRVGTKKGGCSGLEYTFDYVQEDRADMPELAHDELIEADGVKVYISAASVLHLIGTELDFLDEKLESRFVFNNPNSKATCGCGDSFAV